MNGFCKQAPFKLAAIGTLILIFQLRIYFVEFSVSVSIYRPNNLWKTKLFSNGPLEPRRGGIEANDLILFCNIVNPRKQCCVL